MKILAIDTSTKVASIALCDEVNIIAEFTLNHKLTHSQQLMPLIDGMMSAVSANLNDVDLFAVTEGPGSFTGLRIGITTAKGFAYALDKPLVCVNTLEAMAYNIEPGKHNVCPMIDARNNQVFTAIYKPSDGFYELASDYMAIEIKELIAKIKDMKVKTMFLGDGVNLHRDEIRNNLKKSAFFANMGNLHQRASIVAYLAYRKYIKNELSDAFKAIPYYCRKSQAEQQLEGKKE